MGDENININFSLNGKDLCCKICTYYYTIQRIIVTWQQKQIVVYPNSNVYVYHLGKPSKLMETA